MKYWLFVLLGLSVFGYVSFRSFKKINFNSTYTVGQPIDSLNRVKVYYNGGVDHVLERNLTSDNYNLGLKYQCVEFVKRYYYEKLGHKMPDTYGHAKDFYDAQVADGEINSRRNLRQYSNPGSSKPQNDDLVVFFSSIFNPYGHVAIVSEVYENKVEIIQQNPGPFGKSRELFPLFIKDGTWKIDNNKVAGWLRKDDQIGRK